MVEISFTDPVTVNGSNFSKLKAVEAFDEYFSFSGRKYRIIESIKTNTQQGHLVERHKVKPNIPLNILKVVSYLTGIIPLIMLVGKLICRTNHKFFFNPTEKSPKGGVSESKKIKELLLKKKNKEVETHLPVDKSLSIQIDRDKHLIKHNALKNLRRSPSSEKIPHTFDDLEQEQLELLESAIKNRFYHKSKYPEGVEILRGGSMFVFILESVPGYVFKLFSNPSSKETVAGYLETTDKARELVQAEKLLLLNVPEAKAVQVNGHEVIMEQKADLGVNSYAYQKGAYTFIKRDPELKEYAKTLFAQLMTFILKFNYSDVKYHNIPITFEATAALIDLDQNGSLAGLTRGGGGKFDGFFNYLPLEYFDEFLEMAKEELSPEGYQQLEVEVKIIKKRREQKAEKKDTYKAFHKERNVTYSSQLLNPDIGKLFTEDAVLQQLAQKVVLELNQCLKISKNLSPEVGRKIKLPINMGDPLCKKAQEIWKGKFRYSPFKDDKELSFKTALNKVLDELQNSGYILKYKVNKYYPYVSIYC